MAQTTYKTTGVIELYEGAINRLLSPNAKAACIAEGPNCYVYSSVPEGAYIFNSQGKLFGLLKLANAASEVVLSANEK